MMSSKDMTGRKWSFPRPRLRMRTLLGLVALVGLGMGLAREYWSPNRVWRRAVRSSDRTRQARGWQQASQGSIDGLTPEQTRDELIAATGDRDPEVRQQALWWLRQVDKKPGERLPLYVGLLKDPGIYVRCGAVEAVGEAVRMSRSGRELAEPALLALIDDPDPWTRKRVLGALGDVVRLDESPNDPLLDVVARKLDDPDDTVWLEAAYVLSRSGVGDPAVSKLEAFMIADRAHNGGHDPGGTGTADNVLARIAQRSGQRSDEILAFLLREVYRKGQGVPNRFLYALEWIDGAASQRAVDMALKALEGDDDDLRIGAAYFLEAVGNARDTRRAWLGALRHADPDVRCHALNSLRLLDGNDRSIRAAMRSVRDNDPDAEVRKAATDALYISPGFPDPDATP
jgi:HEAT repeat protein